MAAKVQLQPKRLCFHCFWLARFWVRSLLATLTRQTKTMSKTCWLTGLCSNTFCFVYHRNGLLAWRRPVWMILAPCCLPIMSRQTIYCYSHCCSSIAPFHYCSELYCVLLLPVPSRSLTTCDCCRRDYSRKRDDDCVPSAYVGKTGYSISLCYSQCMFLRPCDHNSSSSFTKMKKLEVQPFQKRMRRKSGYFVRVDRLGNDTFA